MILFMENISLINNAGTLLILLVSGILILKGQFTVGLYTSFSLYAAKVFACTQVLAMLGTTLKPVCLSTERIYEILDMQDENSGADKRLETKVNTIDFERVGFRYKETLPEVCKAVSFHLQAGDKVLLQGENGSGKTTLVKLLLGLYQPTSGRITVNGCDAAEWNRDSLRAHIGIVSQNIFLFRGTVLSNILYGQPDKTRQDVQNLMEQLELQDYIGRLANGLDTEISQNTAGVSGGQAQIIALIRALLSRKDVIILDEPISNVDVETRDLILRILEKREYDGIILVISHQTQGIEFLNKIITLEHREQGSPGL